MSCAPGECTCTPGAGPVRSGGGERGARPADVTLTVEVAADSLEPEAVQLFTYAERCNASTQIECPSGYRTLPVERRGARARAPGALRRAPCACAARRLRSGVYAVRSVAT